MRPFWDNSEPSGEQESHRGDRDISSKVESKDQQPALLVSAKLHSDDLAWLLHLAPSPAVREAWLTGEARPEQGWYRLLLAESRATKCGGSRRTVASVHDGWGVLYDEGRDWWDAEAQM